MRSFDRSAARAAWASAVIAAAVSSWVAFAMAQHKAPPVQDRPPEVWRFFHAMEWSYAHGERGQRKKGGIGPLKITEEVWRQAFAQGKFEDCTDPEYARQLLQRWYERYYPEAWKARDFETLSRTSFGGRFGEKDPDTLWFWREVERRMPFAKDTQ